MVDLLELERQHVADLVVKHLACQAGIDVVPAGVGRFLTYVYGKTGFKFEQIGHGRHHDVFDIVSPDGGRLGIVLKLGNQQSIQRELAMVAEFPRDWAKVYASFDYGLVCERVEFIGPDDQRTDLQWFKHRMADLASKYSSATLDDIGLIDYRVVITGSSQRLRKPGEQSGSRPLVAGNTVASLAPKQAGSVDDEPGFATQANQAAITPRGPAAQFESDVEK